MSRYLVMISGLAGDGASVTVDGTAYNPIQCSAMRHGIDLPVVAKGPARTGGYSLHGSFELRHAVDKASPKLRETAALGTKLGKIVIQRMITEEGQSVVAETISLGKAYLADIMLDTPLVESEDGPTPSAMPQEVFKIDYEEIVWESRYKPVGGTASTVTGGWDTDDQVVIATIPADTDA